MRRKGGEGEGGLGRRRGQYLLQTMDVAQCSPHQLLYNIMV